MAKAEAVARWVHGIAKKRDDAESEVVDIEESPPVPFCSSNFSEFTKCYASANQTRTPAGVKYLPDPTGGLL